MGICTGTCPRITYQNVYDAYFGVRVHEMDEAVCKHVHGASRLCNRCFFSVTKHLHTALNSQHRFGLVSQATRRVVERAHRAAHATRCARLRRLQRRLVRHLWRPCAPLMVRDMHRALQGHRAPPSHDHH